MNAAQSDLNVCYELLPKVSRSFALAIEALPEPTRSYVCVAYLLCRVVDTIEDHPTLKQKDIYYDIFDDALKNHGYLGQAQLDRLININPPQAWDAELMLRCKSVFAHFATFPEEIKKILEKNILEMSQGMRHYTAQFSHGGIILKDDLDLDRYCYYVAGTVGNLLTEIFSVVSKIENPLWMRQQKNRGYHFALGLQKTNMIKDVVRDLKRGSVFVPQSWLHSFDISIEDLLQGERNFKVRRLLVHFVMQARNHLMFARDYILSLPKKPIGHRIFCIWPYVLALDTLRVALHQSGLFTEVHEIKVSRNDMFQMMKLTSKVAQYNLPLKFYFNQKIGAVSESLVP